MASPYYFGSKALSLTSRHANSRQNRANWVKAMKAQTPQSKLSWQAGQESEGQQKPSAAAATS
jgi:hypothetical protein